MKENCLKNNKELYDWMLMSYQYNNQKKYYKYFDELWNNMTEDQLFGFQKQMQSYKNNSLGILTKILKTILSKFPNISFIETDINRAFITFNDINKEDEIKIIKKINDILETNYISFEDFCNNGKCELKGNKLITVGG